MTDIQPKCGNESHDTQCYNKVTCHAGW